MSVTSSAADSTSATDQAGIGKSRLTAALLERLTSESHTRLRYSVRRSTPTARFILERAAKLKPHDDVPIKLAKFEALLAQTSAPHEDRAIFAKAVVPLSRSLSQFELSPSELKKRTIDVMTLRKFP